MKIDLLPDHYRTPDFDKVFARHTDTYSISQEPLDLS